MKDARPALKCFGAIPCDDGVRLSVPATAAHDVAVVFQNGRAAGPHQLQRTADGIFEAFVRWAAARTDRPIVAIGGITLDRARDVLDAGATSLAVISDLLTGDDPAARIRSWLHRTAEPAGRTWRQNP